MLVVDAAVPTGQGDRFVLELLKAAPSPRICVLNKVDLVARKEKLLPLLSALGESAVFEADRPGFGAHGRRARPPPRGAAASPPRGGRALPGRARHDADDATRIAETIREKFLERTREEIPYGLGVFIEEVRREPAKSLTVVRATVVVDRDSHKGIVLGAGGRLLKEAGTAARVELERALGGKFFLELTVAARPGWREDPRFLSTLSS